MTLRPPFYSQQLLFVLAGILCLSASSLQAQDIIITQDGQQTNGKILGATASGVQVTIGGGSISVPMASIKEVRMAVIPPEFAVAQKALEKRDFDAALTALKAIERYKGLPTEWAQQATSMYGDIYLEKGELPAAESAYRDFQRLYPAGQGSVQSDLGLARLAAAKKDFATAKAKVEPVIARAADEKNLNRTNGFAYGAAFLVQGQIKEGEGDLAGALESYLKTVTIYYYDRSAVVAAQQKADALRQANPTVFVP